MSSEKDQPPAYGKEAPPGAGFRVPVIASSSDQATSSSSPWPSTQVLGSPPFRDQDGSPVYVGSAIVVSASGKTSVQPGKANPRLPLFGRYSYGGYERIHEGQFDILPIDLRQMEWVEAHNGETPKGHRLVEGGYEEDGRHLFHAIAKVKGLVIPGKTGAHLKAAHVAFAGREHIVKEYHVLCWR